MRPGERYVDPPDRRCAGCRPGAVRRALFLGVQPKEWLRFSWDFLNTRPQLWFYLMPLAWLVMMVELYDVHRAHRRRETVRGVSMAALFSLGVYLPLFSCSTRSLPRRGVSAFILIAFATTLVWRLTYISSLHRSAVHAPGADHRGW